MYLIQCMYHSAATDHRKHITPDPGERRKGAVTLTHLIAQCMTVISKSHHWMLMEITVSVQMLMVQTGTNEERRSFPLHHTWQLNAHTAPIKCLVWRQSAVATATLAGLDLTDCLQSSAWICHISMSRFWYMLSAAPNTSLISQSCTDG